jgi:uncharacterized BrkB/YihY/UPF0761 family membrane protein
MSFISTIQELSKEDALKHFQEIMNSKAMDVLSTMQENIVQKSVVAEE